MLVTHFVRSGLLPALLGRGLLVTAAATAASDPCVKVAGLQFADPADAIACQKSFPFNETLRQNVLSVVSRVFDFYTFRGFLLEFPSTVPGIHRRIYALKSHGSIRPYYETDYDFNRDLWDFTTQLNDGHTRWFPDCYTSYQNILPAPVVILDNGIFIAPDSVEYSSTSLGRTLLTSSRQRNSTWRRLAGAKVLTIGGIPAFDYIDNIARTVSGNYLDHNIRVNSAVSSYRISNTSFSQRLGDLAGPFFLTQTSLEFSLIPVKSSTPELVDVPFAASLIGAPFTDGRSYWANNCAANNQTNGVDLRSVSIHDAQSRVRPARGAMMDLTAQPKAAIGLPDRFLPTLPHTRGSNGVIKSFVLPGNKTGVMFVGSFEEVYEQFLLDVAAAVKQFKASGVTNLLIDVTNNDVGFQTTMRANPLAQKIVKAGIHQRHNNSISFYAPGQFLNGTQMPLNFNYIEPSVPFVINGRDDATSQRLEDICPTPNMKMPTKPPFDLNKVAIIGNGQCASTCALFTTAMFERHQTKIAVFGGNPSQPIQYKGMSRYYWESGCSRSVSQVLPGARCFEWADLDTEIKTAGLKDDPLAPPDLLVSGHMFHNWRSAYSFLNETLPIAYVSEEPQFRFPYTAETYNNPQKVWLFAEKQFFG
ncbi:hypothetical protein BJY52DRAFT_1401032 [Lactarius psammicola]|nr:hypothetical protein BJY52DRAFT_1401032 [Lactarius psammicola]